MRKVSHGKEAGRRGGREAGRYLVRERGPEEVYSHLADTVEDKPCCIAHIYEEGLRCETRRDSVILAVEQTPWDNVGRGI